MTVIILHVKEHCSAVLFLYPYPFDEVLQLGVGGFLLLCMSLLMNEMCRKCTLVQNEESKPPPCGDQSLFYPQHKSVRVCNKQCELIWCLVIMRHKSSLCTLKCQIIPRLEKATLAASCPGSNRNSQKEISLN